MSGRRLIRRLRSYRSGPRKDLAMFRLLSILALVGSASFRIDSTPGNGARAHGVVRPTLFITGAIAVSEQDGRTRQRKDPQTRSVREELTEAYVKRPPSGDLCAEVIGPLPRPIVGHGCGPVFFALPT